MKFLSKDFEEQLNFDEMIYLKVKMSTWLIDFNGV